MDVVIAIDCSTTASKAIGFASDGSVRAVGKAEIGRSSPHPTWYEQDASDWWTATADALRQVADQLAACGDTAVALGITHQRESFVCLGPDDQPIRPAILWLDARAGDVVKEYGTEKVHAISGKPPSTTPSYYKLVWLAQHEPETLRQAHRIADVHAYLSLTLTGRFATSLASADPTGLIDFTTGAWSPSLLDDAGVSEQQLPALVAPGDLIGELSDSAAAQTGLAAGLPVIAGGGDGQCAGLGVGVYDGGHGYLSLGTSITLGAHATTAAPSADYRILASPLGHGHTTEGFIASGALSVSWFHDTFAAEPLDANDPEALLAASAPGANGLYFLPYLSGCATPYWNDAARGSFIGITEAHTKADFYRAVLEGLAFEIRLLTEGLERTAGRLEPISVMGGGAVSNGWLTIIASVLGRELAIAATREATALGAGILAATYAQLTPGGIANNADAMTGTARTIDPDQSLSAQYDERYLVYRQLYSALSPVFDHAAQLNIND